MEKAYVLNQQQLNNLSKFLDRTELKGAEVGAYLELIRALNNPIPVPQPVESPVPVVPVADQEVPTEQAS